MEFITNGKTKCLFQYYKRFCIASEAVPVYIVIIYIFFFLSKLVPVSGRSLSK